jgi:gluconolactonase
VDGVEPAGDELVLDRIRMSAFNGTALDTVLRNWGITDVVIVGVWTRTVRDAADHGYEVTIVSTPPRRSAPTGSTPRSTTR